MRRRARLHALALALTAGACAAPAAPERPSVSGAGVDPRYQPGLEALEAAVEARDDALARRILERVYALAPTGAALELAQGFERILDGRDAVALLSVRVECVGVALAEGGDACSLRLAASSRDGVARTLRPGPATLRLAVLSAGTDGSLSRGGETRSFDALERLEVPASGAAAFELARLPLELPPQTLALRVVAGVDLCAGTIVEDGRALPAMRLDVAPGEIALLDGRLLALGPAAPEDLRDLARDPRAPREALFETALRVRREDRVRALDLLAEAAPTAPAVERLGPALRWLAPGVEAGDDAAAWGGWLDARAEALRAGRARAEPQLPREP